jgi:Cu+-exporting ATPase
VIIDLAIGGMTCASCAARVERTLNRLEGVSAAVNFALETARVEAPAGTEAGDLIAVIEGAGYEAWVPARPGAPAVVSEGATADERDALGERVAIVAVLAVPVIALGMLSPLQFDDWQWLSLMLTFPIATWGAWPFHRAAWANLRHAAATMDTLVSAGVLVSFLWSVWALFFGDAGMTGLRHGFSLTADRAHASSALYFEVAAATTLFVLAGRWFEARARQRGGDALRALADLGAKEVSRLRPDGREERIPTAALRVGDRFVVRPGEQVATDGLVVEGASAIDVSLVTGESVPVEVAAGDAVTGATLNAGGRIVVEATRVGDDTVLARMAALVAAAQSGKAPVQRLADRVASWFVPAVIALAVGTLGYWIGRGEGLQGAIAPAVAVLVVACPCALGLATPMALLVGTGRGAQLGVLIRGPEVLESTRRIDTIVLDKTGTVTAGRMALLDVVAAPGEDAGLARRLAATVEAASEHPIGRAIAAAVPPAERSTVTGFRATAGLGVTGDVDGHHVVVGRRPHLEAAGFAVGPALDRALADASAAGRTAVVIGWDGRARAVAVVADAVRPTSASAVDALRRLGLDPVLVTGDHEATARRVAADVGIERVVAGATPEDKVAEVRRLQDAGRVVAVVGDGVNDAAALARADLGLAMGGGTDAAMAAADLTLVRGDLLAAVDAVRLGRRTLRTIRGNLVWAFAYNVAALPVAASGRLDPMLAGIAMAASSIFVVTNSLRLFGFRSVDPEVARPRVDRAAAAPAPSPACGASSSSASGRATPTT